MSAPCIIPAIDAWIRARERFTKDLSLEEKELYSKATANSVFYGASAAERTHKANSSSRRFASEKLRPLVGAIVEFSKALDVYANAYPLVLSPLWGSIRVVLHVSTKYPYLQALFVLQSLVTLVNGRSLSCMRLILYARAFNFGDCIMYLQH